MKVETTISETLRMADMKTSYDEACKLLLSEKMVLAWIMKSCLREYQDCDVREIAEKYIEGKPEVSSHQKEENETNVTSRIYGMKNEDVTLTERKVFFDIRFYAVAPVSNQQIRLIINVEAQNDFYPGYSLVKRSIYYCSRMITAQYGTEFMNDDYRNLKKVYSVWVCMNPPKYRANSITCYQMGEENFIGNAKEKTENYDLLSSIMIYLGQPNGKNYSGVIKMLDMLLTSKEGQKKRRQVLENDFGIRMTQEMERAVASMCNLSDEIERKGIEKGRKQGRKQGRKEGRKEGKRQGKLEEGVNNIRSLMESMGWSVEQAMTALRISESDQLKYLEILKI